MKTWVGIWASVVLATAACSSSTAAGSGALAGDATVAGDGTLSGSGDAALVGDGGADVGAADAESDAVLSDVAAAAADGTADAIADDTAADATADAATDAATDGAVDAGADAAADTVGDAGVATTADANGDSVVSEPTCGECPLATQPTGAQPGSSAYPYAVGMLETTLGPAKRPALIYTPKAPGPFPVLGFVHGKQLFEGSPSFGAPAELGRSYRPLLEHVAKKGYVVIFVRVENDFLGGVTDADHVRMADDFVGALEAGIAATPNADPKKVAYAGHSMGGKVVLIAAAKATTLDTAGAFADPTLVVPMAPENSAPPIGTYVDARDYVKKFAVGQLWVSYLAGSQDTVAQWDSTSVPNAKSLYEVTPAAGKQLILLRGSGEAGNPATTPTLLSDHMFPGAIEGKNGGMADAGIPASHLDALDWYGVWKVLVGALDYHFKGGSPVWAYGALRTHGGTLPNGSVFTHTIAAEALPAGM